MIDGGVLDNNPVDYVIGAHVTSLAPVGFVATRPGILMSQAQMISVRLDGKGGHGAMATTAGNVILAVSYLRPDSPWSSRDSSTREPSAPVRPASSRRERQTTSSRATPR